MTTYFTFAPSQQAPFQFQPTLDGAIYNVIVPWNLFGQRYYVNIYGLDGTLVLSTAMVGSPTGVDLQALSWTMGKVTATAAAPHGYKIGQTVNLAISGASPDVFNGSVSAFITGASTFTYLLSADPGEATAFGNAVYNISLTAGYFASTLVYRQASGQFEVSP